MDFIRQYYFDFGLMGDEFGAVLDGFWLTIQLSILGGIFSLIWGLVLAVIRQLPGRAAAPLRWLSIAYIDAFRGIPLLLVLLLVSGGLSALSSPIGGDVIPEFLGKPTWLGQTSPFWYGVLSLTITYGAYMAEVYRAGIEAVPRGQMEAARSVGMSHGQAMRFVIVPQAVRKVIPPLLNDFIALMKDTSLVSILGAADVVYVGRQIQSETFNGSALMLGAIFFLIVTIPLARLVDYMIAREQSKTQRGGTPADEGPDEMPMQPGLPPVGGTGGGVAT
jgi:polar amino acid transport system permease protein